MRSTLSITRRNAIAATFAAMAALTIPLHAKAPNQLPGVPVTMTVTASVDNGKRMPEIRMEDLILKQGSEHVQITNWVQAKGDRAGLELFIVIDDASDSSIGTKLDELRAFINAQPPSTLVGVAYMRNATVQIVRDPTSDHDSAATALRLPLGSVGAYGSPYLSVIDLMKRWPASSNRHEVVMITDGIDRAHRGRNALLNPDINWATDVARRTGTMLHSIYTPGAGHWHRNFWEANSGENGLAKLVDITGGESFFLGLGSPVSFTPYLDQLQKILDNQYLLSFSTKPEMKARFQSVSIGTELPGVDLNSADAVWVPASK